MQNNELGPYLTPHTEINKMVKRPKCEAYYIYFLEENIRQKLQDIGSDFLTVTPQAQATKRKSEQVKIHENFKFCLSKTLYQQTKGTPRKEENLKIMHLIG